MSRFWRTCLTPPTPGWYRWRRIAIVDDLVLRERRALGLGGCAEEAHHGAAGRKHAHDLLGQGLSCVLVEEIEDVPAEDAVDAAVRMSEARLEQAGSVSSVPAFVWRSMSPTRSSMNSLQPRRSPKNSTLVPMTGPKSMRTGDGCEVSAARNLGNAFGSNDRLVNGWLGDTFDRT